MTGQCCAPAVYRVIDGLSFDNTAASISALQGIQTLRRSRPCLAGAHQILSISMVQGARRAELGTACAQIQAQVTFNGTPLVGGAQAKADFARRQQEVKEFNAKSAWRKRGIAITPCRFMRCRLACKVLSQAEALQRLLRQRKGRGGLCLAARLPQAHQTPCMTCGTVAGLACFIRCSFSLDACCTPMRADVSSACRRCQAVCARPGLCTGMPVLPIFPISIFDVSYDTCRFDASPPAMSGSVRVYADGSVLVASGGLEMGQGLYTKVKQVRPLFVACVFCKKYCIIHPGGINIPQDSSTAPYCWHRAACGSGRAPTPKSSRCGRCSSLVCPVQPSILKTWQIL